MAKSAKAKKNDNATPSPVAPPAPPAPNHVPGEMVVMAIGDVPMPRREYGSRYRPLIQRALSLNPGEAMVAVPLEGVSIVTFRSTLAANVRSHQSPEAAKTVKFKVRKTADGRVVVFATPAEVEVSS